MSRKYYVVEPRHGVKIPAMITIMYNILGSIPEKTFTPHQNSVLFRLSYIATHENSLSTVFMHISTLSKITSLGKTSVKKALKELHDEGILVKTDNKDKSISSRHNPDMPNSATLRVFNWDKIMELVEEEKRELFIFDDSSDSTTWTKGNNSLKFLTTKKPIGIEKSPEAGELQGNETEDGTESVALNDSTEKNSVSNRKCALDVLMDKKTPEQAIDELQSQGVPFVESAWREILADDKSHDVESIISDYSARSSAVTDGFKELTPEEIRAREYNKYSKELKGSEQLRRGNLESNLNYKKRVRKGIESPRYAKRALVSTGSYIPEMWKDMLPDNWQMTPDEQSEFDEAHEE